MSSPDPSPDSSTAPALPGGGAPRPWTAHVVTLVAALALLSLPVAGSFHGDSLYGISLLLFFVAPLAVAYTLLSAALVLACSRARPAWSSRRIVLSAHGLAFVLGLAVAIVGSRLYFAPYR